MTYILIYLYTWGKKHLLFAIGLGNNGFAYWAEYEECADNVRCDICNNFANFGHSGQNRFDAKEQNPGRDIPQEREQYSKNQNTDRHNIYDDSKWDVYQQMVQEPQYDVVHVRLSQTAHALKTNV